MPDKRKQSPKQIVQGCLVIIVLGAVVVGACTGIVFACTNGDSEEPKTVREQIEDCFNPWDGHLDALEDQVRPHLRDEGSMKTLRTTFGTVPDSYGYVRVRMEFQADNAFGGTDKLIAIGELDYESCDVSLLELTTLD